MNDYSLALFFHVLGALGVFVALGLEWTSLRQMRRATTAEQVREWMRVSRGAGRVGMAAMLMLLVSGFYMMATVWGGVPWITVALGAIILLVVLGVALSGPRMAAIRRAVSVEHGPVSATLHHLSHHPLLWISIQTRGAIALGIVFLMTVKPELSEALLTIGVAIVLGLAAALPIAGRERAHKESAERPDDVASGPARTR
jgi:hypothetical protein